MTSHSIGDDREAGFALIIVLVALATLAAMITALLMFSREGAVDAAGIERLVVARVTEASVFGRLSRDLGDPSDPLATSLAQPGGVAMTLGALPVQLSLEREGSKLDLRRSDPRLIARYVAQLAGTPPTERALAELSRIDNPAELRLALLGLLLPRMPYEQVARDFTLNGQSAGIDPTSASLAVFRALPDLSPAAAEEIVATGGGAIGVSSAFFSPPSRRFSLRIGMAFAPAISWVRRLPFEITSSGQPLPLANRL